MTDILQVSNPARVYDNLQKYYPGSRLYLSNRKYKKYMIQRPNGKWSNFGDIRYEDFTKHLDLKKRDRYLKRATNIPGDWISDPYSPGVLSILLLWQ